MQFTRLRIAGFKSFADPVELRIEEGLTGIVGPNGCGKSNLVEALRWVMGEHAPSTLRSKAMEEVIFAGTDSRPARNIAEVSLLIDNRERDAPAGYNDSDEIEILRRIERDLGSLYRINGREARAKDVQLFFADVATGARSPSLIGQSRIAELIAAKPTDRRIVLEEAAGISGLYSRRREAEQKLAGAERNLERVAEVLAELNARLTQLKREARRAERYRALSQRIRALEAWLLWSRLRAAEEAGLAADRRLGETEKALAAATARLAAAEKAAIEAEEAVEPLRSEAEAAQAAANRILLEQRALEEERARLTREGEELARRRGMLADDVRHEQERLTDAGGSLERLAAERARLETRLPEVTEARAQAQKACEAARAALEEAEAARDEAARRLAEARGRRAGLESDMLAVRRRLDAIAEDLAESDLSEAQGEIAGLQARLEELEAEQAKLEAAQAACSRDLAAAEEALAEAEAGLRNEEDALSGLRTKRVAEEAELAAISESLARAQRDRPNRLEITAPEGLEAAVASAVFDLAMLPLHDAQEGLPEELSLSTLPAYARPDPGGGDAPLVPLVALLPDAPPALLRRLQTVLVWEGPEDDAAALKARQRALPPGWMIVTRSGLILASDGRLGRPSAGAENARLLAARNRKRALEQAVARSRRAESEQEAKLAAAKAAVDEARAHHGAVLAKRAALEKKRVQVAAALQESRRRLAALETRLAAEQTRREALVKEEAELRARLETLEESYASLGETERLEEALQHAQEAVAKARAGYEAAHTRLNGLEREAADITDRCQTLAGEQKAWQERRERARKRLADLEARAQMLARQEAMLARRPQEITTRLEELAGLLQEAQLRARDIRDRVSAAEAARREAQAALRAAQEAVAAAREARARAQSDAEHAAEQLAAVMHEITERFSMPPARFRARMAERAEDGDDLGAKDIAALEAELSEIRAQRERLGAVNLRAEIEIRELSEQHEHLAREQEDLQAAIQRLRQAIGNLNREGRTRLVEAFETVNRHFSELFVRLFEGGRAELKLVESDDPLEAGLEILAQPPGKRLQSLALLSGGEQTLTALALVFAVFLTNPAPICVLDEADAPLDEANVERFCQLLDEMVGRTGTRFLVVTHNELTMARMHRLFGVTMREKGVSQLVSVDLERAERLLAAE